MRRRGRRREEGAAGVVVRRSSAATARVWVGVLFRLAGFGAAQLPKGMVLLAGLAGWGVPIRFHFVGSEMANLTFQLDAMAGLTEAGGEAYRALWRRELRWDREDDWQLERWKGIRQRQRAARSATGNTPPAVAWPPNYSGYYGQELGLDQEVRIAGLQAGSVKDYGRRLRRRLEKREADGLVSVVKHFRPRFGGFWQAEGQGLVRPKARRFETLAREQGIAALADQLAAFTEAELGPRREAWFYLIAHPTRFGKATVATMLRNHAPVELLDAETPEERLGVIVHELVHHFYDRAPLARHLGLIAEFQAAEPGWRMAAYSYLNEAVATAAQVLVERRLRTDAGFVRWAASPRNVYAQPWVAALGVAAYPLLERCLGGGCGLFTGFTGRYLAAAEQALGERVAHPHFLLASRIVLTGGDDLRGASRLFRERVPSIMHATGWDQLARFPGLPVVVLAREGEQAPMLERIGPGREVTVFTAPTVEAVEREVERFAMRPF